MDLKSKYSGVIVPMVSPFNDDYSVNQVAVQKLVASFVANDIKPFAISTTGEGYSMTPEQKSDLVKFSVKAADGKQPVLAGISGNSILTSIEDAKKYADLGADALVSTLPNAYPMNVSDMILYFEKLADAVPLPLFIYNIPATTHLSIPVEAIEKVSHHLNIIGVKDSERNPDRLENSLKLWKDRTDFLFLIGWAAMSAFGLQNGATGIIPSTANLTPELYKQLVDAAANGNFQVAGELQEQTNLISALYQKNRNLGQSLAALKVLLSVKNLCGTQVMPPLVKMSADEEDEYRREMIKEFENLNI